VRYSSSCSFELCTSCQESDSNPAALPGEAGDTEMIRAARLGSVPMITKLLKTLKPGTVDDMNDAGNSALLVAAAHGHTAVCTMLIEAKANLNHVNKVHLSHYCVLFDVLIIIGR
jgi:ankyrin repeat protein